MATLGPVTLTSLARRHVGRLAAGAALLSLLQASLNLVAWMGQRAVDAALERGPGLGSSIAGLLGLSVAAFGLRAGARWLFTSTSARVEVDLRERLVAALHTLGPRFWSGSSRAEALMLATEDANRVGELCGELGAMSLLNGPFAIASTLQVMLAISPKLAAIQAVALVATSALMPRLIGAMMRHGMAERMGWVALTDVVQRSLSSLGNVVRPFGLERVEEARYRAANEAYVARASAFIARTSLPVPLMSVGASLGTLAVFWVGGRMLQADAISPGEFLAFWVSSERLSGAVFGLSAGFGLVQSGRASLDAIGAPVRRAAELSALFPAELPDVPGAAPALPAAQGDLVVEHLTYGYDEGPVLSDVAFTLPQGRSLAVVGPVGSGKTTLALLLAGLLPVPPRSVTVGGVDLAELPLRERRRVVAYAPQDRFLFSTTVRRNVALALDRPFGDDALASVRGALATTEILDEIDALPGGLETVVGERGVQLSGGQRQRVALARALLVGAPVLVLDDPMSAVDTVTERKILSALERLRRGRTLVVVTQRAVVAERCDAVLVLEGGRVVEHGSPAELARREGSLYAAMAADQRADARDDAGGAGGALDAEGVS